MIIDGKKLAQEILEEVVGGVKKLNKPLRLAAVLVGNNPANKKFLELKQAAAKKVGIDFRSYEFPENITTKELRSKVNEISKVKTNSGVIVELPLPPHINAQVVLNAIPESKDIDVLSQKAQGEFFVSRSRILPLPVEVVKIILGKSKFDIRGKNCVVFGYGLLVGRQVSHWLAQNKATVTIINETTANPSFFSQNADLVIAGVGRANLIKSDMIKNGAIVIDFGISYIDGRPVGDIDFTNVTEKALLITPVPGGTGPMVIAVALKNLLTLNS